MGLFSRKSRKDLDPKGFYEHCLVEYHKEAKKLGYAERDGIFIPELVPFGIKAVTWYLTNDGLKQQIPDPTNYYYVAINTAIRCGILFGNKWHVDYPGLNESGYVEDVMESGPSTLTGGILRRDLGMDDETFADFCQKIFKRWADLHEPYWDVGNAPKYTFNSILAAYQLGISMILCKYGF